MISEPLYSRLFHAIGVYGAACFENGAKMNKPHVVASTAANTDLRMILNEARYADAPVIYVDGEGRLNSRVSDEQVEAVLGPEIDRIRAALYPAPDDEPLVQEVLALQAVRIMQQEAQAYVDALLKQRDMLLSECDILVHKRPDRSNAAEVHAANQTRALHVVIDSWKAQAEEAQNRLTVSERLRANLTTAVGEWKALADEHWTKLQASEMEVARLINRVNDTEDELATARETIDNHSMNSAEWAELYKYRAEKGPDGFDSWRDAAVHERILRVDAENKLEAQLGAQKSASERIQTLLDMVVDCPDSEWILVGGVRWALDPSYRDPWFIDLSEGVGAGEPVDPKEEAEQKISPEESIEELKLVLQLLEKLGQVEEGSEDLQRWVARALELEAIFAEADDLPTATGQLGTDLERLDELLASEDGEFSNEAIDKILSDMLQSELAKDNPFLKPSPEQDQQMTFQWVFGDEPGDEPKA